MDTLTYPGVTTNYNYNFVWNTPMFELLFSDYLARDRFHLAVARPVTLTPVRVSHDVVPPHRVRVMLRVAGKRRHERNPLAKRAASRR